MVLASCLLAAFLAFLLRAYHRDLMDRKEAERALRESEDRYRRLVEVSPDALLVHRDGKILFVNATGVRMLGAESAKSLLGADLDSFSFSETDASGTVHHHMTRLDGSRIDVEIVSTEFAYQDYPAVRHPGCIRRGQRLADYAPSRMDFSGIRPKANLDPCRVPAQIPNRWPYERFGSRRQTVINGFRVRSRLAFDAQLPRVLPIQLRRLPEGYCRRAPQERPSRRHFNCPLVCQTILAYIVGMATTWCNGFQLIMPDDEDEQPTAGQIAILHSTIELVTFRHLACLRLIEARPRRDHPRRGGHDPDTRIIRLNRTIFSNSENDTLN